MKKKKTSIKSKNVKFCKYCGTEIRANAKICPNCKKKQNSGVLKWVIVTFVFLGIIGALFGEDDSEKESKDTNDTKKIAESNIEKNKSVDKEANSEEPEEDRVLETESSDTEQNIEEGNFYPRETDEIITITDYVTFWQNYSNTDMNRWYRITGRISNIGGNSFTIKDGLPDNFTAMISCYFNEDEDLSSYRDGDTITFVGFSGNKIWDSLMIEHCFLEK